MHKNIHTNIIKHINKKTYRNNHYMTIVCVAFETCFTRVTHNVRMEFGTVEGI